jgi:NAD(P)-dependent dehydrogenase (short-subunit alcohol dehydrogenase family)
VNATELSKMLTPHKTKPRPPHSIEGRLFAITGAASGIGRATAKLLIESGAKVDLADTNEKKLLELARTLGPNARACKVDVTKRKEVEHWLGTMNRRWNMPGPALDGECMGPLIQPG